MFASTFIDQVKSVNRQIFFYKMNSKLDGHTAESISPAINYVGVTYTAGRCRVGSVIVQEGSGHHNRI